MAQHGAHPQWSRPIPPPPNRPPGAHGRTRRPHWRVLTWVILAFNALIAGVGRRRRQRGERRGRDLRGRTRARRAMTSAQLIGTGMLIFVWMAGAVILGVIWLVMNQHQERDRRERRW